MTNEDMKKLAKMTLWTVNPFAAILVETSKFAVDSYMKDDQSNLQKELEKQRIALEFAQIQAKINQELAIAKRIEDAEEVEIEEYYDISGKGDMGLQANEEGIKLGLSAEGNKVTKRIYRFKARSAQSEDDDIEQ